MYTNIASKNDLMELKEKMERFRDKRIESYVPEPVKTDLEKLTDFLRNQSISDKFSKNRDRTLGPRLENGKWMIGNLPVSSEDGILTVGNAKFIETPGLWDLILKTDPKNFSQDDLMVYKEIMDITNAINLRQGKPSNKFKKLIGMGLYTNSEIADRIVGIHQAQEAGNDSVILENERQELITLLYSRGCIDKDLYSKLL